MHRTDVKDDTGQLWYIFHNGDWSGEAMIRMACDPEEKPDIIVPGFILRNACRQALAQELSEHLDNVVNKWCNEIKS